MDVGSGPGTLIPHLQVRHYNTLALDSPGEAVLDAVKVQRLQKGY